MMQRTMWMGVCLTGCGGWLGAPNASVTEVLSHDAEVQQETYGQDLGREDDGPSIADSGLASALVAGIVAWEDGSPIVEGAVQVRLCRATCRGTVTDDRGRFVFEELSAGTYTIHAGVADDPDTATSNGVVVVEAGQERILDRPMMLNAFAESIELDKAGAIELAGLTIDADPTTMRPGYYSPSTHKTVSAVKVHPFAGGVPTDGLDGSAVVLWELGNFDTQLTKPWPFEVNNSWALAEGQVLTIRWVDNEEHAWAHGGTAVVQDGVIRSTEGSGIGALTTLILVLPK